MKFTLTTVIASLALASLGIAAPARNPTADVAIEQRSPNQNDVIENQDALDGTYPSKVEVCPALEWVQENGIPCATINLSWNVCARFTDTYRRTLSTVKPQENTWCVIYHSQDCSTGASDRFTYPGMALNGPWAEWNDDTGSIECW